MPDLRRCDPVAASSSPAGVGRRPGGSDSLTSNPTVSVSLFRSS